MAVYDCGDPDCSECKLQFGPGRAKAIANYHIREKAMNEGTSMLQPCEETTIGDIENCKALIADLETLSVKAEQIALRSGDEMNSTADFVIGKLEQALVDARATLNFLEADHTEDDRRAAAELRREVA
jgi:hypothetical protein